MILTGAATPALKQWQLRSFTADVCVTGPSPAAAAATQPEPSAGRLPINKHGMAHGRTWESIVEEPTSYNHRRSVPGTSVALRRLCRVLELSFPVCCLIMDPYKSPSKCD